MCPVVKCAQTGKELVVKPKSLSQEDEEPLSKGHFTPGQRGRRRGGRGGSCPPTFGAVAPRPP